MDDCRLRKTYKMGQLAPKLGVAARFAYPPEDSGISMEAWLGRTGVHSPKVTPKPTRGAPKPDAPRAGETSVDRWQKSYYSTEQRRGIAFDEAYRLLAMAVRDRDAGAAHRHSQEAFAKLESAFGSGHRKTTETKARYPDARRRCQEQRDCATFGDSPGYRTQAGMEEIENLRHHGRFDDAVILAAQRAVASVGNDPFVTAARYAEKAGRIHLFDRSDATSALGALEQSTQWFEAALKAQRERANQAVGFVLSYSVDAKEVASAQRARALANLALGKVADAAACFKRALELEPSAHGSDSTLTLSETALLEQALGSCERAHLIWKRATELAARPKVADAMLSHALLGLATNEATCGSLNDAIRDFGRAGTALERLVADNGENEENGGIASSLAERRAFLMTSLALSHPGDASLAHAALRAVLARKGVALSLLRTARSRGAAEQPDREKLRPAYASIAKFGLDAVVQELDKPAERPKFPEELWKQRGLVAALEEKRTRAAARSEIGTLPGIVAAISARVPADRALLEYTLYTSYDFAPGKRATPWGTPRYAVFVVQAAQAPKLVDLGDAAGVEPAVAGLRAELASQGPLSARGLRMASPSAPTHAARAVYEKVFAPAEKALSRAISHYYVSADGALLEVPFAALESPDGRCLLDRRYVFDYQISGRELLRGPATTRARTLWALGNANYGTEDARSAFTRFQQLPNTESEVQRLAGTWATRRGAGAALVLSGDRATKEAIMTLKPNAVIHLATHGWFVPDPKQKARTTSLSPGLLVGARAANSIPALLRTGLAVSRANLDVSAGQVTGLELSSLELEGTQLVVLSACETGSGAIQAGEGVFGLHRAFLASGAETVVSSLWSVADEATAKFMQLFYAELIRGADRIEALHSAARQLKSEAATSAPFFWAPFVAYGQGGALAL